MVAFVPNACPGCIQQVLTLTTVLGPFWKIYGKFQNKWKSQGQLKKKKQPEEEKSRCLLLLLFSIQFALLEMLAAILLLAQNSLRKQVSPVTFSLVKSLPRFWTTLLSRKGSSHMQIPGEMLDRTDRVGANGKKVSTNVISFLEKVSEDYLIFDMVTFHCFCLLMLFSVWLRLLTYRSCLIYFILFIGWGSGTL